MAEDAEEEDPRVSSRGAEFSAPVKRYSPQRHRDTKRAMAKSKTGAHGDGALIAGLGTAQLKNIVG